jgi:mono/diheme cytochrome c family protein
LRFFLIGTFAAVGSVILAPKGTAGTGNSPAPAAQMPGQPIYENVCSRCHGPEGRSERAPSLVPFLWNYSQALDIVRHGGPCGMPAFRESELSDEELRQIVDYLKTFN